MNWFQLLYDHVIYIIALNVYYFGNIFLTGSFFTLKINIFIFSSNIIGEKFLIVY